MSDIPQAVAFASVQPPHQPLELSYVSLAGEQVPAATRENAHLLQHAADYQVCVRNLRRSGIGDLIWGVICGGLGFLLLRNNQLNAVLLVLSAVLVGVGMWILIKPSPIGMIADGCTLLLLAGWNLFVNVLAIAGQTGPVVGYGPVIIIAQIYWGLRRLKTYPRFATAVAMQPSPATVRWLGELANSTAKAKPKNDPTVIEFNSRGFATYERWKGRLMPEMAVLVSSSGSFGSYRDVLLATQDGVEIQSAKKKLLSGKHTVKLRVGQRALKVIMPEDSLRRLQAWIDPERPIAGAFPIVIGSAG